jgi:hypothetical protein
MSRPLCPGVPFAPATRALARHGQAMSGAIVWAEANVANEMLARLHAVWIFGHSQSV